MMCGLLKRIEPVQSAMWLSFKKRGRSLKRWRRKEKLLKIQVLPISNLTSKDHTLTGVLPPCLHNMGLEINTRATVIVVVSMATIILENQEEPRTMSPILARHQALMELQVGLMGIIDLLSLQEEQGSLMGHIIQDLRTDTVIMTVCLPTDHKRTMVIISPLVTIDTNPTIIPQLVQTVDISCNTNPRAVTKVDINLITNPQVVTDTNHITNPLLVETTDTTSLHPHMISMGNTMVTKTLPRHPLKSRAITQGE